MAVRKRAPFKRPTVEIGSATRAWKTVSVSDVHVGDTVAGVGLIDRVRRLESTVHLTSVDGSIKDFDSSTSVLAFVQKD
jgi:hypothetical protein